MLSRADVRAHLVLVVIILHGCGMFLQIVVRVCCSYTGHGINDLFHTDNVDVSPQQRAGTIGANT